MQQAYKKYVNKTVRTVWLKDWTADLLAKLDAKSGLTYEEMKAFCEQCKQDYVSEIKKRSEERAKQQGKELNETSWKNSAANNLSHVRNAIKLWQQDITLDELNSYEQQTKTGIVRQHLALLVMNFDSGFHTERKQPTEDKKQDQRRNLVSITNVDLYQSVIEQLLESREWREVAVGLISATGRRATEILKTAEFKQIGQFEVEFSGQLKAKGEERKPYPTFTLLESNKVCDALLRLRRMPEIKELKQKTLSEVDSGRNSSVNRLVVEKFSPIIQPPAGELKLSTKNLRASYAAIAIYLFCRWSQEPSQFITEKLGHTSDATASNYQDYQVVDNNGKPLTRGAWVKRIGEEMSELKQEVIITPSRVRLTKNTWEVFDGQEFLPFADRPSRLEELVRLAKVGKQFESGELVKEVVVEKVVEKIVEVPVEKIVEVSLQAGGVAYPLRTNKRSAVEKSAPAKAVKSAAKYDKRPEDMTNEELFGANLPNSGHEKIRRAVAAVKSYNEDCGGDKANMWAINIRTLKDLTNCRTEVVDKYFRSDEGIEELGIRFQIGDSDRTKVVIGYNEMLGLGRYHNRGRGSICEVIKLK